MLYPTPLLPLWTAVIGFGLGAIAGSFLNMLIWRLPRGKSLIDPAHSICPVCNHRLTALDLVPIVSWLRTRGKCRHCKAPIAARYLWVEALVGTLFAILWMQTMCVGLDPKVASFALYAAAAAILVAIVFIDGELYIIPDELNAALLFVGLGYGAAIGHFREAAMGAFLGWAILWGFVFLGRVAFGKDAMGDGDIKMMRGVGALLGPTLLLANVGIGVLLGLVGGIIGLAVAARREKRIVDSRFPIVEGADSTDPRSTAEAEYEATPVSLVLLGGVLYLFCVDILALFLPPLARWIAGQYPPEMVNEEDDWEPGATAIPFGPYLAAGAIVCMLAGGAIERGMKAYWDNATGRASGTVQGRSGRTPRGPFGVLGEGLQSPAKWNKGPVRAV